MNSGNHDENISIIYHQKNDSPKYFEITRSKISFFLIGLPTLTLIAIVFGTIGVMSASPVRFVEKYKENQKNRIALLKEERFQDEIQKAHKENENLREEIEAIKKNNSQNIGTDAKSPSLDNNLPTGKNNLFSATGLSTLFLFKPIQGQKDLTRSPSLNLSGFQVTNSRDTINFKFNIMPSVADDSKIAGHIIILMKNEFSLQVYPPHAFSGNDFQIDYTAGESFATQRFRPVDASFIKPKKAGNYSFSVFIFSRIGDLLSYQTVLLPVTL